MNGNGNVKKHTISLYVSNKPGVLIRIALVFARRAYNIDSLVVSESNDPAFSYMNIVATGDERTLEQILKQLNKLVDVVHATDRTGEDIIHRELALMKVYCNPEDRTEILQLANAFQTETVDLTEETLTVEVAGKSEKIDALGKILDKYGILETIRTGKILMTRGGETTA